MKFTPVDYVAFALTIVGGLNWGLNAFLQMNIVSTIFGSIAILEQVVYALVSLSALYLIYFLVQNKKS
jgi:uncharacterized membrane protein YuzA (DUF378 family)